MVLSEGNLHVHACACTWACIIFECIIERKIVRTEFRVAMRRWGGEGRHFIGEHYAHGMTQDGDHAFSGGEYHKQNDTRWYDAFGGGAYHS